MADKLSFRVVKGLENEIMSKAYSDGYVYFTTDTKKIYFDTKDQRLSMGGNTGIYYADASQPDEGEEFFFNISDIEDEVIPNVKDLILNTDGCFYKVEEVMGEEVKTIKLTIAGSGGSGGTGSTGSLDFDIIGSRYRTILAGKPFYLEFSFSAVDETGAQTGNGRYEIKVNKVLRKTGVAKQGYNSIEIGDLFKTVGEYSVDIFVYGYTGGSSEYSKSRHMDIISTAFTVEWDYDETDINYLSDDFEMKWNVSVDSDNQTSYITIDDKYNFESTNESLIIPKEELRDLNINHGAHKFELYTKAYIGGDEEPVYSDHIIKNVMFYDDEATSDPGYIINCKYFETAITQYDTIQLPVMIYHPDNINGTATISFNVNGEFKSQEVNCKNLEYYTFSYTPDESGFVSLQFICGAAEKSFILDVIPLDLTVDEVSGYEFKFKATEFTNDTEIKNWSFKDQDNIERKIEFSETFDWINGGLKSGSDDVGPYFKIQAGSWMKIPYKIFSEDLKTDGACFKMIFKASNCRDYDAVVIDCMNNNRGLSLKAQGCEIKSLSNSLIAKYCEDSYIEYEFDVCKYSSNVEDQYLTIWIDGIPAGVAQIAGGDSFLQPTPQDLKIGSDDCDVYIYLIKFYKKHLTSNDHLNNFIMDAPNAKEMMERFNRNDITIKDSRNNVYISPELLAEKNPDCNVYIYEVPYIPTSKKDVVDASGNAECCTFTHLKGSKEAIRYYEGVKLRAQGTSSMSYGISAYNLDSKFPEKWSIDDEAIPVNYMNTKVNVASCEGANNALNQEWYNKFQPYKNQKRLESRSDGKVARDTMEFKNGVLFIKDNNKTLDDSTATKNNVFKEISGYVENPYPRMYSIANMGNSKKNVDVFHGAGNQYECCVEVADNNTATQQMIIIGGFVDKDEETGIDSHEVSIILDDNLFDENGFVKSDIEDWGQSYDPISNQWLDNKTLWKNTLIGEGFFEFRYCVDEEDFEPTGKFAEFATFDDYQWELSNRFLRLVRWFAKNNPSQATGEAFETPITLQDYTVKGVKATAYSNYNSADEVLKDTVITGGTFTHDTAEYRVMKMLHESENYVILDSLVYHYLFIERHTMADNVAKNTFWNTEDGIHWEMTKDYDNDTADGVNNNGYLVFDYGIEVMDPDANGVSVFNANNASWLHFIYGLVPLREKMYQTLDPLGAWSANKYLEMFEEWQSQIPEICWIEDYNRKYFRPNNVYGDSDYLIRLANGKKTHQRKQYEVYHEQYMDSRYQTNVDEGTSIQWRSKQPDNRPEIKNENGKYEIKAKVKLYADGYFTSAIASGSKPNIHIRGKKGEIIEFSKAQDTPFTDATCYVYSPNLYQEFINIEALYAGNFNASAANKLRKISLLPQNDIQKTILSESLSFGSNIEEIIIKDCINATLDLDLTNCVRLKTLNTLGSDFTSYSIADGAPLEEFKINAPVSLSLSNLRYLNKIDSEGNELFTIQSFDRLGKIEINNIDYNDINSKDIVNQVNKFTPIEYNLENVKWEFNNDDNITNTNIPLLDYLLTCNTINKKSKALSLTGNALVPNSAYSGNDVINLYNKYGLVTANDSSYPNLILDFVDNNNQSKLYTINIYNGNNEIVWSRQYDTFNNITNNDLINSAYGAFNPTETIKKSDSTTEVFTFTNQWKYTLADGSTGLISGTDDTYQYLDLSALQNITEQNINIEPNYTTSTRYYTITFYDKDNETPIYIKDDAEYNTDFDTIKPIVLPYKDDSNLSLRQTYKLKGYSASKTSTTLINEAYWRVTDNASLYTVYEEVSIDQIDYSEYLVIENNVIKGFVTNNEGAPYYQGRKIRIPAGITRIEAGSFNTNKSLKKVFVTDTSLKSIGLGAFTNSSLEYFEFLDNSITSIENEAFQNCPFSLEDYNYNFVLPEGLTSIGSNALNNIFNNMYNTTLHIYVPHTVTTMRTFAIGFIKAGEVTITIGNSTNLSSLIIDPAYCPIIGSNRDNGAWANTDIKYINFYTNTYSKVDLENMNAIYGMDYLTVSILNGNEEG